MKSKLVKVLVKAYQFYIQVLQYEKPARQTVCW